MEAAPDRRVKATPHACSTTHSSRWAIEKGYDKTTIQDILDRADVGRSMFDVHVRDKEAL